MTDGGMNQCVHAVDGDACVVHVCFVQQCIFHYLPQGSEWPS